MHDERRRRIDLPTENGRGARASRPQASARPPSKPQDLHLRETQPAQGRYLDVDPSRLDVQVVDIVQLRVAPEDQLVGGHERPGAVPAGLGRDIFRESRADARAAHSRSHEGSVTVGLDRAPRPDSDRLAYRTAISFHWPSPSGPMLAGALLAQRPRPNVLELDHEDSGGAGNRTLMSD